MSYQIELVWNHEFNWAPYGEPKAVLSDCIRYAQELENAGDGARVKKTRIFDCDTDDVVWIYGQLVKPKNEEK